ncbi:hypothetical protein BJ742DRAFT_800039 [Cladochytrium replicatum]|nr:hypothetical protein BJ742DRAFT_800039 [Cladochytrium replicatum]
MVNERVKIAGANVAANVANGTKSIRTQSVERSSWAEPSAQNKSTSEPQFDAQKARAIVKEVVQSLYSNHIRFQNVVIPARYSRQATFTDPLVKVQGVEHIQAQFNFLGSAFPSVECHINNITEGNLAKNGCNVQLIAVDSFVAFSVVPRFIATLFDTPVDGGRLSLNAPTEVAGAENSIESYGAPETRPGFNALRPWGITGAITLRVISRFEFNERGLIEVHEDLWSFAEVLTSGPILGPTLTVAYDYVRKLFGNFSSSTILRLTAAFTGSPKKKPVKQE